MVWWQKDLNVPHRSCVTWGRLLNSSVPKSHHLAWEMRIMKLLASENYNGIKQTDIMKRKWLAHLHIVSLQYMMKVKALVAQSCPTLCDPVDCSPPGSSVHGILQARILEWVAVPFSRGSSQPRDRIQVSCIAGGFWEALEPEGLSDLPKVTW